MILWKPSDNVIPLWERLQHALPEAPSLVAGVVEAIVRMSAEMWAEMSDPRQVERRDQYLIRYTVSLAELAGWPARADKSLLEALALHWMFAVVWRRLDDVLDSSVAKAEDIAQLSSDLLRVGEAHHSIISNLGLRSTHEAGDLISHMCRVSTEERLRPLPLERIWERAAPFFIVPRSVLRLTTAEEWVYRDFLCADGLAHDVHDLADDLARGIRSLPAYWLQEIDPRRAFRREVLEAWSQRAAQEIARAVGQARSHDPGGRYRSIAFWLDVAEDAAMDLSRNSVSVNDHPLGD